MLMFCTVGAMICQAADFTLFESADYGNCYTFQESRLLTRRPGPLYGMILTLNIELMEYLSTYTSSSGIKLVIHEPGTQPLLSDEGLTTGASQETNIGLKMFSRKYHKCSAPLDTFCWSLYNLQKINISRLGAPYGRCDDGKQFKKDFGITYTVAVCMKICKYKFVTKHCNCKPLDVEVNIPENNEQRYCSETVDDRHCVMDIENKIDTGKLDCACQSPCREIVYDKTLSVIKWPEKDYLEKVLMPNLCAKNLSYASEICSKLGTLTDDDDELLMYGDSFLRVNVYYENLNYENIQEDPLYDEYRFMSDIGGTLGLFLGASLLSFFEFVQLVIEITVFLCRRKKQTPISTKVQSFDDKQSSREN